mmetsp:Transcript_29491/g.76080  ORF Transcript_29491/g.76080 Transcript_29491/m.76080 type:complete len:145 (-) Transcript_29491:468-902(-)
MCTHITANREPGPWPQPHCMTHAQLTRRRAPPPHSQGSPHSAFSSPPVLFVLFRPRAQRSHSSLLSIDPAYSRSHRASLPSSPCPCRTLIPFAWMPTDLPMPVVADLCIFPASIARESAAALCRVQLTGTKRSELRHAVELRRT